MRRTIVIVLAGAAVVLAAYLHYRGDGGAARSKTLQVLYTYSSNQEELLLPLIETFNDQGHEFAGQRIEVVGESVSSGDAEAKIAGRKLHATIWSPASSLWGSLLDHQVGAGWTAGQSPALVRTPLVIALWKPEAEALGWPRKPIGFAQILDLATSQRGWADYGLPTFGQFKLGHTNPDFSTSGLSFVTAEYYVATGKREGLTVADVGRPRVRKQVRRVQQSIVHYGDTGSFFVDQLKAHGPGYISAVAMEEVTLLDYNRTKPKRALPLVAVYPAEGTFYFDNPLITLRAPWVTRTQSQAAAVFVDWIGHRVTPQLAARYGYRPGDPALRPAAPIDRAHLVDPAQPRVVLGPPEPRVLAKIKRLWHDDRKAANVAIVVDVSGSMQDEDKLRHAQDGLRVFLRQFSPRDRVGLVTFADRSRVIVPIAEMRTNRVKLESSVEYFVAGGGTAVYDATSQAVDLVASLNDSTRINAVVVLTDGEDNRSSRTVESLLAELRRRGESDVGSIRVFTIAYGDSANKDVLASIAAASGGKDYSGDPAEIESVYRQISSF
ncbi:MAG: VWA domain-containing protein, partial [Actinomycetota bacterium]|nr:VWA domain-containing protein [Actinomycetota bacterium]